MNNGWIDISECTEGYYLFIDDKKSFVEAEPIEIDDQWNVHQLGSDELYHRSYYRGKALKIADINNNGDVLVEQKK